MIKECVFNCASDDKCMAKECRYSDEEKVSIIVDHKDELDIEAYNTDYIREDVIKAYANLKAKGLISKERFDSIVRSI